MELEDITIERYDEGELVLKEEDRFILSKGAWSTVMYLYRELNKEGELGDLKARLVRYQKRKGQYRAHSKFNLTSPKQIHQVVDKLTEWIPE